MLGPIYREMAARRHEADLDLMMGRSRERMGRANEEIERSPA